MCYADTAYIVAYLYENDPFHASALSIKQQVDEQSRKVWASEVLILEALAFAKKKDLDPIRFVRDALALVLPDNFVPETALKAAWIMQEHGNTPADSLHIANSLKAGARLITCDMPVKETLKALPGGKFINLRSHNPTV